MSATDNDTVTTAPNRLPAERPQAGVDLWNPSTLDQAMKLAEMVANSDLVPKDFRGKPGNVLIAMQMGRELGMPPLMALQNIAVINGRPAIWGDLQLAVVIKHPEYEGHKEDFDETTMTAVCTVKRRGKAAATRRFSMQDAEQAGLTKKDGPWRQYPKRMLQMRARAFALRDTFADALKGIQQVEEVRDIEKPAEFEVTHSEPAQPMVHATRVDEVKEQVKRKKAEGAVTRFVEERGMAIARVIASASELFGREIKGSKDMSTEELEAFAAHLAKQEQEAREPGADG